MTDSPTAVAIANKATYGGASATVFGAYIESNLVSVLGLTVAVVGLGVNWYFQWKRDQREQAIFQEKMAELKNN